MFQQSSKALIVIDPQNDYFSTGSYPLWNTDTTLKNIEIAINKANKLAIPVIIIQHIANNSMGTAPFFNKGTEGAKIHPRILSAAPEAPVVVKEFADSFEETRLDALLKELNVSDLILCGMMTQNCVTHTAISKKAEKYNVSVLTDCCTTVDVMIHMIALHALSSRITLMQKVD